MDQRKSSDGTAKSSEALRLWGLPAMGWPPRRSVNVMSRDSFPKGNVGLKSPGPQTIIPRAAHASAAKAIDAGNRVKLVQRYPAGNQTRPGGHFRGDYGNRA